MARKRRPNSRRNLDIALDREFGGMAEALKARTAMASVIAGRGDLDLAKTRKACERLFRSRHVQEWPPRLVAGTGWPELYAEAAKGLDVRADVGEAIEWTNALIEAIDCAKG